jgi:hypothetical protein
MWGLGSKTPPPPRANTENARIIDDLPQKQYFRFFLFSLQQIVMGDVFLFHSDP